MPIQRGPDKLGKDTKRRGIQSSSTENMARWASKAKASEEEECMASSQDQDEDTLE
jgi:hypothetical protein